MIATGAAGDEAGRALENRIKLFIALPFEKLEARALQAQVREIGHGEGASSRRGDAA